MVKIGDIVTILVTEYEGECGAYGIKRSMRDGGITAIGSEKILYTRNGIEYEANKSDVYLNAFHTKGE